MKHKFSNSNKKTSTYSHGDDSIFKHDLSFKNRLLLESDNTDNINSHIKPLTTYPSQK